LKERRIASFLADVASRLHWDANFASSTKENRPAAMLIHDHPTNK
jgi:hypothetical protein